MFRWNKHSLLWSTGALLASVCLQLQFVVEAAAAAAAAAAGTASFVDQDAVHRKQWYLRKIRLKDYDLELPVSYATVIAAFYVWYFLYRALNNTNSKRNKEQESYCLAWHILLRDHGVEAAQQLTTYRDKIGNNPELFAKYANKYSACPSSFHRGSLGKFAPGDMDPHFEAVCFDPHAPLQTTLGPIHSRHGFHLIWIQERRLGKTRL